MAISNKLSNPNIVAADPAKGFFVSMLIKDITLRDAIGDLVDNAVDAIKARAKDVNNLKGYNIVINLSKNSFSISDNGFGMEAEIARKYAFNFGKSNSHKLIDKSIGQFGIGMKRAFFKLGTKIHVKSVSASSQFELSIDVSEWQKEEKKWEFEFDKGTLKEKIKNNTSKTGLEITISNLSDDSKTSFTDKTFIDTLQKEISLEHMLNINKGLIIKIDGYTLKSNQITLVNDSKIKPSFWEKNTKDKNVKILAGVSTKDADEGGWYIFCNDRLIIAKNQHKETGWGDGVPKYHAQYHRFRGYVFFEAKDSSNLPWNTTKTGMDMDSPYFKEVRSQMIIMTLQVMDLLNKLKEEKEKDNPEEVQTLNIAVEKSLKSAVPVTEVLKKSKVLNSKFHYPITLFNPPAKSKVVKIAYQVSQERFEAVKQQMEENNPKEVGLKTFKYYYDNEI
jgi:Histidine kinase-, DNA gyrase B-, and HSP90-like ATPase